MFPVRNLLRRGGRVGLATDGTAPPPGAEWRRDFLIRCLACVACRTLGFLVKVPPEGAAVPIRISRLFDQADHPPLSHLERDRAMRSPLSAWLGRRASLMLVCAVGLLCVPPSSVRAQQDPAKVAAAEAAQKGADEALAKKAAADKVVADAQGKVKQATQALAKAKADEIRLTGEQTAAEKAVQEKTAASNKAAEDAKPVEKAAADAAAALKAAVDAKAAAEASAANTAAISKATGDTAAAAKVAAEKAPADKGVGQIGRAHV